MSKSKIKVKSCELLSDLFRIHNNTYISKWDQVPREGERLLFACSTHHSPRELCHVLPLRTPTGYFSLGGWHFQFSLFFGGGIQIFSSAYLSLQVPLVRALTEGQLLIEAMPRLSRGCQAYLLVRGGINDFDIFF